MLTPLVWKESLGWVFLGFGVVVLRAERERMLVLKVREMRLDGS